MTIWAMVGLLLLSLSDAQAQNWLKKNKKEEKPRLVVAGSVSCKSIFDPAVVRHFAKTRKWDVTIYGSGSEAAIEAVYTGAVDLAISTRPLTEKERAKGLRDSLIAYDAIAVVVHKSNPVQKLSMKQLNKILRRKIKTWKKLGWLDQPISVILPDTSSGLRTMFLQAALRGKKMKVQPKEALSTYGAIAMVRQDTLSITICSLSQTRYAHLKPLAIEGIRPSKETIANGTYPLRVPVFLVTKGQPTQLVQTFLNWMMTGKVYTALAKLFYVPTQEPRSMFAE
ncbi:MAG: substrate-binding domain-containing protein [candidate division KSB1 bacterium]|nr:substrate-binding domain-containing protein [candidate division KSB1 bacterium]